MQQVYTFTFFDMSILGYLGHNPAAALLTVATSKTQRSANHYARVHLHMWVFVFVIHVCAGG